MNTKAYHIGHEALNRFTKHTGIAAEFSPTKGVEYFEDATIRFHDPRLTDVFDMEIKNEVRNHHLHALLDLKERSKRSYILIAQTIFPPVKDYLRKNGVNYIDMAGNASIQANQVHIFSTIEERSVKLKLLNLYGRR